MNKTEFTGELAERLELSRADASRALDAILDSLTDAMAEHDEVSLTGWGNSVRSGGRGAMLTILATHGAGSTFHQPTCRGSDPGRHSRERSWQRDRPAEPPATGGRPMRSARPASRRPRPSIAMCSRRARSRRAGRCGFR
jgi:hypothetical protein